MAKLVFDIETIGMPLASFDETQQEYLLRYAKNDEEREQQIRNLNLTPLTARVGCIAMLNMDSNQARVVYLADEPSEWATEDGINYIAVTDEAEILKNFWQVMGKRKEERGSSDFVYEKFVTFNGRTFDCPFVMLRSALLGIRPSRNMLAGGKYNSRPFHIDLIDELTFYMSSASGPTRKFNFDFYCKAFGIPSSKAEGVTGNDVNRLFGEKRYKEIAEYCMRDVRSTALLYNKWKSLLSFTND